VLVAVRAPAPAPTAAPMPLEPPIQSQPLPPSQ
jgi:hypothetical protein